jgi:hypothetical protein
MQISLGICCFFASYRPSCTQKTRTINATTNISLIFFIPHFHTLKKLGDLPMKFQSRTLAVAIGACLAAPAYAIQITDYIEPESLYEEAYIEGSFSSRTGNQDKTSFDANFQANYERVFNSRERNINIYADGRYQANRGGSEGATTIDDYRGYAIATVDNYLAGRPNVFWYAGAETEFQEQYDDIFLAAGAGMGYGRVTIATPLAYAIRVVEELQQHNAISGNVSDNAYLQLAQVINRRNEFRSQYGLEEYEAEFMAALEAVMKETGIAPNGLNAGAYSHMRRVLFEENINVRKYGWLVRGGLGLIINDFNGESGDPSIDLGFEYALPVGLAGQFLNRTSYSAVLVDGDRTSQKLRNLMSYTHELSDTIDWVNTWALTVDVTDKSENVDTIYNELASTFRYYLTNRLTLNLTLALSHLDDDIKDNGNDDVNFTTYLGVRYRLR